MNEFGKPGGEAEIRRFRLLSLNIGDETSSSTLGNESSNIVGLGGLAVIGGCIVGGEVVVGSCRFFGRPLPLLVGWIADGEVVGGSSFFFGRPLPFLMADWLDGWIGTTGVWSGSNEHLAHSKSKRLFFLL
jgi:hypothetical protein